MIVALPFFRPVRAIRGIVIIRQYSDKSASLARSLPLVLGLMAFLLVIIMGADVLNAECLAPGAIVTTTPSDALDGPSRPSPLQGTGQPGPRDNRRQALASVLLVFGLCFIASTTGYVAAWAVWEFNVPRSAEKRSSGD